MGYLNAMLKPELVAKHARRLIEAEITVKSHTRHSEKGKAFTVKTYQRTLDWSGDMKGYGSLQSSEGYSIHKFEGDIVVTTPGGDKLYYDTVGQAKKAAYDHYKSGGGKVDVRHTQPSDYGTIAGSGQVRARIPRARPQYDPNKPKRPKALTPTQRFMKKVRSQYE